MGCGAVVRVECVSVECVCGVCDQFFFFDFEFVMLRRKFFFFLSWNLLICLLFFVYSY
jgi:hypothetical protein